MLPSRQKAATTAEGATDGWASVNGVDLSRLHVGLEEYGGYCDCEVVVNVHPDDVFEPVRKARA